MLMRQSCQRDRGVLREDRDAALLLEVVRIHRALRDHVRASSVPACRSSLSTSVVLP